MAQKKDVIFKFLAISTEFARAAGELGLSAYLAKDLIDKTPAGDGHAVMVTPGFLADDGTTYVLRQFLQDKGYDVASWGQGRNLRLTAELFENLDQKVKDLYEQSGGKISLVGHSLGGVISMIVAARNPDYVRSITTLGSPLRGGENRDSVSSILSVVFEYLNEKEDQTFVEEMIAELAPLENMMEAVKDVPVTAIYTEGDGVVDSDIAVVPENDMHRNIKIHDYASHVGLTVNPQVLTILADLLARPEGDAAPFDRNEYKFAFTKAEREQQDIAQSKPKDRKAQP